MLTLHHVTKTYGKGHLRVDALRDVELPTESQEECLSIEGGDHV